MTLKRLVSRLIGGGGILALLTLGTGALFKIAAFAREAFIAARFGLSSLTDAYFAFQQFPLILVAFMFGAFALAFTPVYAAEKRAAGTVEWLPGLIVYGGALGAALTLALAALTPQILRAFAGGRAPHAAATLILLSCSFAPILWLGIWAGTSIAAGRNLLALFVSGLPYLFMTLLLFGLFALGKLNDLSLPLSFLAGFAGVGLWALLRLLRTEGALGRLRSPAETWKMPGCRRFLRQLAASSAENLGYSANQLLLVFFLAQTGAGAVSANTCAMRVGMLGFSLLGQPLAQLVQAKLCAAEGAARAQVFKKWLAAVGGAVFLFAVLIYAFRGPVTGAVYLHGNFSALELARVVEMIPAWVAYFVVASLNALVARYLFASAAGNRYMRRQLCAYLAANLIRFAAWGRLSVEQLIWCSVLAEGCALAANLRSCFGRSAAPQPEPLMVMAGAGAQEA